jgi:hypothetical protein
MHEEKFDLFKLHDDKLDIKPRSWICASKQEIGPEVHDLIESSTGVIGKSRRDLARLIAKKLSIGLSTTESLVYECKDWIPLIFISELLKISKESSKQLILDKIDHLANNTPPRVIVKVPKKLTINLCKIAGAHAADGCLFKDNLFQITDGDFLNVRAFQNWLKSEFDLDYQIRRVEASSSEWKIAFHNKVFGKFLHIFFDFPYGKKVDSTGMPNLIRNSAPEFRKALTMSVLGFESGLGAARDVSLCVLSKKFRDDIAMVVRENNLTITILERPSLAYWRFWSGRLSDEEAKRWMDIFEPNTEKWYKLQEYSVGFKGKVSSLEEAVNALNKVYPRLSANKVITSEVLLVIKKLNRTHRYEIANMLRVEKNLPNYGGKWAHSLRHHIDILKETNIIKVQKKRFEAKKSFGTTVRDEYSYNPNVEEWVLPLRKSFEEIN